MSKNWEKQNHHESNIYVVKVNWSLKSYEMQGILRIQNLDEYIGLRTIYLECNGTCQICTL